MSRVKIHKYVDGLEINKVKKHVEVVTYTNGKRELLGSYSVYTEPDDHISIIGNILHLYKYDEVKNATKEFRVKFKTFRSNLTFVIRDKKEDLPDLMNNGSMIVSYEAKTGEVSVYYELKVFIKDKLKFT
jgi:hypothetical protein